MDCDPAHIESLRKELTARSRKFSPQGFKRHRGMGLYVPKKGAFLPLTDLCEKARFKLFQPALPFLRKADHPRMPGLSAQGQHGAKYFAYRSHIIIRNPES